MSDETVVDIKGKPAALRANRMKPAEFTRTVFHAEPAIEDKPDDLLRREYWLHFAGQLRGGDRVEIMWEDCSKYAEGIFTESNKTGATFEYTVGPVKLGKPAIKSGTDQYEVKWAGPHAKHRVLRLSDNEVMKDGFETKELAERYILATIKAA